MTSPAPTELAYSAMELRVIVWPPTRVDGEAIGRLLEAAGVDHQRVNSMDELRAAIHGGAGAAMLAEELLLTDADSLIQELSQQPVWSDIPLLILSRSGGEAQALSKIMNQLGNVSVIERPVRATTLLSLVRSSQRARARQYDVRRHLADRQGVEAEREQLLRSERAARSDAERASRMKEEFLATLSHELRTPLHAVLGWTQVLRRMDGNSEEMAKGLSTIERNARAQAQIIDELLDMSSIISGKVRLNAQVIDLATIVTSAAETIRPTAQAKGVQLQTTLDPRAGPIHGDPNRLQQILWNLLTNAMKFTRGGGRVQVTLARVRSHVELRVEDDGDGIDAAFLPHIFDRFRQADASISRSHGGLGLGLSIVKQLVELHGGTIVADSAGRGAGSSFRLTFPMAPAAIGSFESRRMGESAERSIELVQERARDSVGLDGLTILVVDDELDSRTLLQRFLEERGARVILAVSADEALASINRSAPDVLVSDIGMPGRDGYALIREVRALQGPRARIPAIALTAYARSEDRVKAMGAGYQSHLAKPVEPIELVAVIRSLRSHPLVGGM
ncbi:MAG: hybrid sensor histidine kinase/response regulator [Steroidobacterales bacterium]